ncbi:MAG: TetR/AcrR family transcriptional regulator [Flavobacteriaceae bacterium]|nr:TetR/AcrR family transcriptional regulator [Flavobacteriaceae bacterium]
MTNARIHTASELFITYGFKEVTMDMIAQELGISKKTLYEQFSNKKDLVKACVDHLFQAITKGIFEITQQNHNPIEELYIIKKFAMEHMKGERSAPQYQLKRYYPSIFKTIEEKQYNFITATIEKNIIRGIKQGLYRKSISIPLVVKLYYVGITSIKNQQLFPQAEFPAEQLQRDFLEHHLRSIVTEKGLKKLKNYLA